MKERGETRLASNFDPAAALDSSATRSYDPDWWRNGWSGFGHDFHNLASQYQGFDAAEDRPGGADQNYRRPDTTKTIQVAPKMNTVSTLDNTTKTSWDAYPSNPFNINANYLTYDKTDGAKMTE